MKFSKYILTVMFLSVNGLAIAQPQSGKKISSTHQVRETPESILKYFRNKDINKVVSCAAYPFKIDDGGPQNEQMITSPAILRKRLTTLFAKDWFSDIKKTKAKKLSPLKYGFESRSFNKKGELESESMVGFDFKITKKGYKVCGIWMAD